MRNLVCIQRSSFDTAANQSADVLIKSSAWDVLNDCLICVNQFKTEPNILEVKRIKNDGETKSITFFPNAGNSKISNLHHFSDTDSICAIFNNGNIVLVQEASAVVAQIVGSVDSGISAAMWSPDEEVLAITTGARSLLLMTRDFDLIKEVPFSSDDVNASRQVAVGWGKSETQFKGKHARAMKDPTVPEKADYGKISEYDDGATLITWRGDGQCLAVSSIDFQLRRLVRLFNREGVLENVSEPVDGLEPTLSWKPSGSLVASTQRISGKLDIIFFERNGLRHGDFTADCTAHGSVESKINDIFWNCDSSFLAVCYASKIQLWCVENYHWYLKQEVYIQADATIVGFKWHPEIPLRFLIFAGKCITVHQFILKHGRGSVVSSDDPSMIGVVDGKKLQLTPFRYTNVPPPMSYGFVELRGVPLDISYSPDGKHLAVLQQNGIDLIQWTFNKSPAGQTLKVFHGVFTLHSQIQFRQISFFGGEMVCVLGEDLEGQSLVHFLKLSGEGVIKPNGSPRILTHRSIIAFQQFDDSNAMLFQDTNGDIIKYEIIQDKQSQFLKLPLRCPWMESIDIGSSRIVVGLSETGRLHVNDRLVSSTCTSFVLTNLFLVFTTGQHLLKFAHLKENVQDIEIVQDNSIADERSRVIERGARLVCVVPSKFSVILQMPRGNLETVFPRALVLAGTRKNIETRDYKAAFLACRDHRVDLNLLHDYVPHQFFEYIGTFVKQLKKLDFIDLFLSQLREDDVTQTMYPEVSRDVANTKLPSQSTNKVNRVCNALIEYLEHYCLDSHLQNIVTAHMCKSPPDNEAALRLITRLRGQQDYERAIIHICFLSDVNKLYDTALGLYDIELALVISQQAQKDPREYLPFLQSLQDMDENRQRYSIDNHLGRFLKALESLFATGDANFAEARQYINDNDLYIDAFQLYKYEPENLKILTIDYATYLERKSQFREAGFAYESVDALDLALVAYRKAALWKECLNIATMTHKEGIDMLALTLVHDLRETKEYGSAARVYLDYLDNVDEAIRLLCQGNDFNEAMRVATLYKKNNLLHDVIDLALGEKFGQTTELVAECKIQLVTQANRITELQRKRREDPLAYFDSTAEVDAPDNISLAPTNASTAPSLFTRYTGHTLATALTGVSRKSSKNRRKEERKRARGKKGSVYEEEYLYNSLCRLAQRVNDTVPDTEQLIECMLRRQMRENASIIQAQMQELISQTESTLSEILISTRSAQSVGYNTPDIPAIRQFKRLSLI